MDAHADLLHSLSEESDAISGTLNYEIMYEIVKRVMQESHQLLETLCQLIATEIKQADSRVSRVVVTVKKKQPPLGGRVAFSAYTLTFE